jgi:hypothetical protein
MDGDHMSEPEAESQLTGAKPAPPQVWFRVEQVEVRWLPVSESAFLLWVLVLLLVAWLGIGVALGLV